MARPRRPRSRRKSGPPVGLIVGILVGGLIVAFVIGLIAVRRFGNPVAGLPIVGGDVGLFDAPNPRVTEDNYQKFEFGMPEREVERILGGPGRMPVSRDFDAIFGERIPELSRMPSQQNRVQWEEHGVLGRVRLWSDGPRYMLVLYSEIPNRGKVLTSALYKHDDGSYNMMAGGGNWPVPPSPKPAAERKPMAEKRIPPPKPGDPMPSVTVEQMLADYEKDRDAADAKYRHRKVKVSGVIDSVLVSMVTFRSTGAQLQAQLDGVATGMIGKKKPGDALVVVGRVKAVFPPTPRTKLLVLLEYCSIEE